MGNIYCGSSKYTVYIDEGRVKAYKFGRLFLPPLSFFLLSEGKKINLFDEWEEESQSLFYVKGKNKEGEIIVQISDKGVVVRFYINNTFPFTLDGVMIKIGGDRKKEEREGYNSHMVVDEIRGAFVGDRGIIGVVEDVDLEIGEGLIVRKNIDAGGKGRITLVISFSKEEYDLLMSSIREKELRAMYNLVDKDFLTLYTYFFDNFDIKCSNYDLHDLVNVVKNNIMLNVKRVEDRLIFVSSPFKFAINVSSVLSSLPFLFHLNDHDIIKNTIDFLLSYVDKSKGKLPLRLILNEEGGVKEIIYDEEYEFYLLSRFLTVVSEYIERTGDIEYGDALHPLIERMEERVFKRIEFLNKNDGISKHDLYALLSLTTYYKDKKIYRTIINIIDKHMNYVTHSLKKEHVPQNNEELVSLLGIFYLSSLSKIIIQNFVKELGRDIRSEEMRRIMDFFSLEGRTLEEMHVLLSRIKRIIMENPNLLTNSFVFDVIISKIMEIDVREIKNSIVVKLKSIMKKGKVGIYNMNYQGLSLSMLYDFTRKKMKINYDVKDRKYGLKLEMPFDSDVIVNGKKIESGKEVYVKIV